jgi:putative sigma-54 modulation protein
MNLEIKSVHFDLPEDFKEMIQKKYHKIEFAEQMIVDMIFTITREKSYITEATINMRWGASHHFRVEGFDLRDSIDKLFAKMDQKISKEKDKIKSHQ